MVADVTVTVQGLVPTQAPPPQPENTKPDDAVAVKVTFVFCV